ncbi:ABC transporter ATP-binding protein [Candidatus Roizmanbacteria bacterium]|nr:ABC transporter ATP-binding protein [Candidatus Roizmanbacteria bacterium]
MDTILSVSNLTKRFGDFTAVDNISFELKEGEILGLLGPNGAGKTTTIHILLGITSATSGKISYFDMDFFKNRQESLQRINFASSFNTLQGKITVLENLLVFARLYDVKNPKKRIHELLEFFEMREFINKKYWDLSSGQRTRVNLVKALINSPEIILMDEPTAALDPDISDKLLNLIEDLRSSQKLSILYTSHDMAEVTRICDRVIFLDKGKIIAEDTPLGLTKRIPYAKLQLTFDADRKQVEKVLSENKFNYTFISNSVVQITAKENLIPTAIFKVSNADVWITDIEVYKPTLEDFFLQITRSEKKV